MITHFPGFNSFIFDPERKNTAENCGVFQVVSAGAAQDIVRHAVELAAVKASDSLKQVVRLYYFASSSAQASASSLMPFSMTSSLLLE